MNTTGNRVAAERRLQGSNPCLSAIIVAVFLWGCAALPLESPAIPHPSSRLKPAIQPPYHEVTGVIHVHSTYSDGRLPVEEIAQIASREGLDYLILTDHDTLQAKRDGKECFYGKTLVLVGEEISTSGGHYLALHTNRKVPRRQDPQWTIEAVSAEGGLGFIAHPFWKRRPWRNLETHGMTGVEIYSAVQDVSEENPLWLGFWTIMTGSEFSLTRWLDRPKESLALWDRMLSSGRHVVGIGSPDAHGLQRFGLRLGPYETMFKLVRTHLLVREFSEEEVYHALASGHAFVAHDMVADARGFVFAAVRQGSVEAIAGDEVKLRSGLQLYAYLPSPGEVTLWKDGKRMTRASGQEISFPVQSPGVYRVEATHKGKPWIYSNPIYVTPPPDFGPEGQLSSKAPPSVDKAGGGVIE